MSDSNKAKRRHFVPLSSQDDITAVEHPNSNDSSPVPKLADQHGPDIGAATPSNTGRAPLDLNPLVEDGRLHRGLSARQVQMIAVAGG